ncbi:3-oxoadipyl-CoA thiolase [Sinimarinibacterium flocculans]|uniref:3-oxoadipyl-CoA thiolase n=1 Tax=Sinimarinibacterium flocculans TaxID=985250 RepID=UPI002493207B|nr:3-oxoadipyl-CoA thiolase [Sinimarinibacterium flocculans]
MSQEEAFVCDAIRTPIGRYAGALGNVRADDLSAIPLIELLNRNPGLPGEELDEVFLGCANQAGEDNRNVARMSALLAGLPATIPGVTLNRLCGSGLDAVGSAARAIRLGEIQVAIAGGVESMSRAPFVMGKSESAFGRAQTLEDTTMGWRFVNPRLEQRYGVETMPRTGENVAQRCGVSRDAQDLFALRSQQRAARAQAEGFFAEEIVAVEKVNRKGTERIVEDEHPRPDTTLETLSKLKSLFAQGTVTAGNSSGINDGAAALIVASAGAVQRYGLTPRARILGMTTAGVEPTVMGLGPVPATRKLLARLRLSIHDFDCIEVNEAFAAQAVAVLRELGLPESAEHVNPNGGAIALGHPLGMSGARLVLTAVHQLQRQQLKHALVTMCVGVGQGISLALERV